MVKVHFCSLAPNAVWHLFICTKIRISKKWVKRLFENYLLSIFFSIVIHDEVSILCILPQRLRYVLKVASSITFVLKSNLSQLSVSAHSFLAILNLESISARLWGYCASVILANTLDEDLRSWKTVLELPLIDLQSSSHFVASSSECSSNKFFAILFSFHVLRIQITA